LNRESYKRMIKAIKDINAKLDVKIRKGNDEGISDFNYTMLEIMNKIFKQVVIEVNNHLYKKVEKESNYTRNDHK